MNTFLNGLKNATNFTHTENGAITHKTTKSALLDMFALGAAYRKRSEEDCILLFKNAYNENPEYALKCLFYHRDCRGGSGERRFFRICLKWLAQTYPEAVIRNIEFIPEFGRWDDLYCLMDTEAESVALELIKNQLILDLTCDTPSLCAKWVKSENASSKETRVLGEKTRIFFGMSHRNYRKMLSLLRSKVNVLEKLMSENKWDEIKFDKIPSKAGIVYKNAFARRDIIKEKYERFAKDKTAKVNAAALYPHEVVAKALQCRYRSMDNTDRLMVNKYWENLPNWVKDANFNGICVCDTSGSMAGTPINVAISLSLYCAERAGGPFANHYISFASRPQLIETNGVDFVDKVRRIYDTNLVDNTDIEAVFDLLLNNAIKNNCTQEEIPQNIVIISDMQVDAARGVGRHYNYNTNRWEVTPNIPMETLMESIRRKWAQHDLKLPCLIYWNVDARDNTILDGGNNVSYVSGFSPSIFRTILTGKTNYDLMLETLNDKRYTVIH